MFKKQVWDYLSFMQEAVIRIWYTVIMKSEERLWHVNNAQRIIKETKYPKKISPTPNQRHPELLIQGSMNSSFHVGYSKYLTLRNSSDQETFFQTSIFWLWWAPVNCSHCSWSTSRFHVFCIQRWFSNYSDCSKNLFEVLLASLTFGINKAFLAKAKTVWSTEADYSYSLPNRLFGRKKEEKIIIS